MKIWCIFKSDTAIKWRELLVVDEPPPLACVAYNIFVKTPEHPGESNGRQRVLDSILAMLLPLIVEHERERPAKIEALCSPQVWQKQGRNCYRSVTKKNLDF
jgi:hypothetical protein